MKGKYENKNEFYCLGRDYESYLNTEEDFDFNRFSRKTYNSLVKKGYLNLYGSAYSLTEK